MNKKDNWKIAKIKYNIDIYINSDEIVQFKAELSKYKEIINTLITKYINLYLIEIGLKNWPDKKIKKNYLLLNGFRE